MTKAKHGKMLVDGVTTMFDAWMLQDLSYAMLDGVEKLDFFCLFADAFKIFTSFIWNFGKNQSNFTVAFLPTTSLRNMK